MRTFKTGMAWVVPAAALAVMPFLQGCVWLVAGGVIAGATYGTVKYVNNTLHVTQEVSLDTAWTAATGALKELQMPVTASAKDGTSGKLEARNPASKPATTNMP